MCMDTVKVKKTCQEVITLIDKAEDVMQKLPAGGCLGCQGKAREHIATCETFSKVTTQLSKSLLKLQLSINGVIAWRWAPKGIEFIEDLDAVTHSFIDKEK